MISRGTPGRPRKQTDDAEEQHRLDLGRKRKARHQARQRQRYKPILDDFFSGPCTDCGQSYPRPAMEADHVRGAKKHKIAWFTFGNGSMKSLLEELAKCEVRCCNCHSIRHAVEDGRWPG